MPSALRRRVRPVATALAHVPAVAAIAARHVGRDPWKAASVGLRAAPARLRDLLRSDLVRRQSPVLAIVADAAAGRREQAVAALEQLIPVATVPQLRASAAVCAVLDRPDLADAVVARLPEDDPERLRLQALAAWAQGDLHEAVDLADAASSPRRRAAGTDALASSFRGELGVLEARAVHELTQPTVLPGPDASERARGASPAAYPGGVRGRPRVLHVVTNALPEVQAGYTIRTQGIAAGQRDAGIDAEVVTRLGFPVDTGRRARSADFVHGGVPTHRLLPVRGVPVRADDRLAANVDHLERLARELGTEVLHAHSKHDNGQAALLAGQRLGVPVVYEARGFLEETWRSRGGRADSDFYRLSREAETACMRAADAVVTVSESMRRDIVARGIDPAKVVVVGNSVPMDYLAPVPDATALRADLGVAPDAVAVGLVSTLNDYEGVDVLLEAVALVDDPRLVAVVVGDGPARSDLQSLALRLLPPERAIFTGRVPHARAREHHAALDVFAVPRRRTAVTELVPPIKPLEAMATERPVVVSDLEPLLELVGEGSGGGSGGAHERGFVAAADDPGAWAEVLHTLLYAPDLRTSTGQEARRWVGRTRTWDAAARTYADLYARITG